VWVTDSGEKIFSVTWFALTVGPEIVASEGMKLMVCTWSDFRFCGSTYTKEESDNSKLIPYFVIRALQQSERLYIVIDDISTGELNLRITPSFPVFLL
jgi:hypothetical protein